MTRLTWPGGEHDFELRLGELRRLQTNCDAGPEEVFNRLRTGRWRIDDVIEPLRLGLIGGGMKDSEAGPMVMLLIEQCKIITLKVHAIAVLGAALLPLDGEDDPVGKPAEATPLPQNGVSPASTETAQSSDLPLKTSTA